MVHDVNFPRGCRFGLRAWWTMRQVLWGGGFRRRRRAFADLMVARGSDGGSASARRSFSVGHGAAAVDGGLVPRF